MERYRAIKYIKTTRSAEMFRVFLCLLAASEKRREEEENYLTSPPEFSLLFLRFYRWETLALLLFLSLRGSDEQHSNRNSIQKHYNLLVINFGPRTLAHR